MNIVQKLCHPTNYSPGRTQPIKYIVIHYTANNGDTALGNASYFARKPYLRASAGYFVDENDKYQSVRDSNTAWHCGADTTYVHPKCRNSNSIGVELCSRRDIKGHYYFADGTVKNAIELTRYLMDKHGVGVDCVLRHYDVTGKICPAPFVGDESQWVEFKSKLVKGDEEVPDWMQKIMDRSVAAGLIEPNKHNPNENATKWFVLGIGLAILKIMGRDV